MAAIQYTQTLWGWLAEVESEHQSGEDRGLKGIKLSKLIFSSFFVTDMPTNTASMNILDRMASSMLLLWNNSLGFWEAFYVTSQLDYHSNGPTDILELVAMANQRGVSCSKAEPQMEQVRGPKQPGRSVCFVRPVQLKLGLFFLTKQTLITVGAPFSDIEHWWTWLLVANGSEVWLVQ